MALARLLAKAHRINEAEMRQRVEEHEVRLRGIDRELSNVREQLHEIEGTKEKNDADA